MALVAVGQRAHLLQRFWHNQTTRQSFKTGTIIPPTMFIFPQPLCLFHATRRHTTAPVMCHRLLQGHGGMRSSALPGPAEPMLYQAEQRCGEMPLCQSDLKRKQSESHNLIPTSWFRPVSAFPVPEQSNHGGFAGRRALMSRSGGSTCNVMPAPLGARPPGQEPKPSLPSCRCRKRLDDVPVAIQPQRRVACPC